ncbi:putative nicotinamidase-like [Apostichopus japonicus]|uniref:Putative nicotinamidase-like n=1 Tax=Stichopus japonicus TaxID=307972 RepID=A0A2G8KQ07_STIJA|nr:putative nicotinamidase-like [Apostichopus japonicus]
MAESKRPGNNTGSPDEVYLLYDSTTMNQESSCVGEDGRMTEDEFKSCWKTWIYPVLHPKTALLVVDVQNDFISGTLALKNTPSGQDGAEVVPVINKILDDWKFDLVAYSQDWHPYDHISFIDNVMLRKTHSSSKIAAQEAAVYDEIVFATEPPTVQTLWPAHCLQNSEGAKIHPNLKIWHETCYSG